MIDFAIAAYHKFRTISSKNSCPLFRLPNLLLIRVGARSVALFAEILNMSPDSPDAQIFKEYAKKHESKNGTAAPAAEAGN